MTASASIEIRELVLAGEAELTTGPFGTQLKAGEYVAAGVPLINVRNLGYGGIRVGDLEFLSDETAIRLDRHRLESGDIVFGRKGAVERHAFIAKEQVGWIQGSDCLRLRLRSPRFEPRFVSYYLLTDHHAQWIKNHCSGAATMASLNQDILGRIALPAVELRTQRKIAVILSAYDDLIENNSRRIQLLEEMAQRIYREWVVDFGYPGHEHVPLVNSELGPIPEGWVVRRISEIASPERYAVTSGPFGSKLGRKDYLTQGVPVIRGTNLSVGGAFRDTDFVFVSEAKADAMPSCQAHPGDILVTQRGTLGQVGIIPPEPRFPRYVISQSQMKITVDPAVGSGQYLYAALRSPEVTARLQAQAMTAGVPHINLSILRNFQVIWPTLALQNQLQATLRLFAQQVETLNQAIENARATRDVLLPRLISGEVDVTAFGIAIPEAAT